MKFSFTKVRLLNFFYFFFFIILIVKLFQSIRAGYSKESWQVTEFLINYQGGFVRRGLLGEFILFLYHSFGINPYFVILAISIISLFTLFWFFTRSFIKNGYTLFFLPFVFFLGNPIIQNFWVRKDILIILIFILTIYCAQKGSKTYLIFANIFLILGLLIHESIGFFSFPMLLLILSNHPSQLNKFKNRVKSILFSFIYLIPSLFTFFCVLYFKGSTDVSQKIWNSWKPIQFPLQGEEDSIIPAAIDGLSWSLQEGLRYSTHTLRNFSDGIYAPIGWLLIILLIYFVLTNTDKLNFKILNYRPYRILNKQNISNVLIIQLISIIPLFILGWDYSRWVFFWTSSSFAIILLIPEKDLSELIPSLFTKVSNKLNFILNLLLNRSYVPLFCLFIGFPAHSWSFISTINTNSVTIVLKFISKVIEHSFVIIKVILINYL